MSEAKKEKAKSETKEEFKAPKFQGLYRSETNKVIAGVAGGLGEYFDIEPTIIRILFVLMAVFGGSGLIIYLALWLIIPSKSGNPKDSKEAIRSNIDDMKSTTESIAHNLTNPGKENSRFWWAMIIIVLGFFFLMNNYGLLDSFELDKLWPLILIIFGLAIILRKR